MCRHTETRQDYNLHH